MFVKRTAKHLRVLEPERRKGGSACITLMASTLVTFSPAGVFLNYPSPLLSQESYPLTIFTPLHSRLAPENLWVLFIRKDYLFFYCATTFNEKE